MMQGVFRFVYGTNCNDVFSGRILSVFMHIHVLSKSCEAIKAGEAVADINPLEITHTHTATHTHTQTCMRNPTVATALGKIFEAIKAGKAAGDLTPLKAVLATAAGNHIMEQDYNQRTPLFYAVQLGNVAVVCACG